VTKLLLGVIFVDAGSVTDNYIVIVPGRSYMMLYEVLAFLWLLTWLDSASGGKVAL